MMKLLLSFLTSLLLLTGFSYAQTDSYLDVVTYNIEWLGRPDRAGLSMSRDEQLTAAAQDILDAGADVYALQEIVIDDVNGDALADLLSKLNSLDTQDSWSGGYNSYFSYWWNPDFNNFPAQRQAFVYRNSTLSGVSFTTLLTQEVPAGDSRFASGRLPFMLSGTVTINGSSQPVRLVNLHLKCCTGNADRRLSSMQTLVTELNASYASGNVLVLGDMNVADNGGANGEIATWGLYDDLNGDQLPDYEHAAGAKTDLAWDDIDHILISDELTDELAASPASLHNQTLSTRVSDHKPIMTSLYWESGATPDTEAPTAPANLSASTITESSFTLSWDAATDNVGVNSYTIYQDGGAIGSTSTTSYSVSGLSASTTYSYTVTASDAAGNTSPASNPLAVTTADPAPAQPMVSSITLGSSKKGKWYSAEGTVNVTSGGSPLANVLVEISWSGAAGGTDSGYTDGSGQVTFKANKLASNSITLTINNLSLSGYSWDVANSQTSASTGSGARLATTSTAAPANMALYPNPFRQQTELQYTKQEGGALTIAVYDLRGQLRETVADGEFGAGNYVFSLGKQLPAGQLFLLVVTDNASRQVHKLLKE